MLKSKVKSMFGNLKTYTKQYIEDESGMEIIEAAVLFGIAVFLATGVMMLANKTDNGMNNVGDKIDKEFDRIINSNNDH